ncbi:hypothetical protein [Maribellus sp. YY47]|uniref:hypothetical protein n=1 Tax=Maribellus sp. YY47 TaxID=2929486 RepID=UPI0020015711|nr:hypothetical protein [Maribellus sp. YY47]MCK3682527.1 hypothetical protein [Maribellus sp. YY47]
MKRDRLEDFVKANRGDFDFREPSPELWSRIAENSKPRKVVFMRTHFYRVAAVVAIAVIGSVLVWKTGIMGPGRMAKNADPELLELMETEAYYSYQVDKKMEEIQKCYFTNPELKDDIESDLNELEGMYKVLKSELDENISNKSVIEAMIENNRFRLKLCDDVLEQLKC